ncbi:MAG: RICIN domain-containing protein [Salinivirgaceae bacterium]
MIKKFSLFLAITIQFAFVPNILGQSNNKLPTYIKIDKNSDITFEKGTDIFLTLSGKFKLIFDATGNLVVTENGKITWESKTANKGAEKFVVKKDGNLIIQDAQNTVLWTSNSGLRGAISIVIDETGYLAARAKKGQIVWWTYGEIEIKPGANNQRVQYWYPDQIIFQSIQKKYFLLIENNQLTIKDKAGVIYWSTPKNERKAVIARFSKEGELGIYSSFEFKSEDVIWATNTAHKGVQFIFLADDGYLYLNDANTKPVWTTNPIQYNSYFQFGNTTGTNKVNIEHGPVASSVIAPGWFSAQWIFEPVDGTNYVKIKNRWKGTYLNIENGPEVQCTEIAPGWHSAHWRINPAPNGGNVIKNRWENTYLVMDVQTGNLKCTSTNLPASENGQWDFNYIVE